eukprot:scaffold4418_cov199-Prasinococcus_capsulatus_cf.AAC.3
MSDHARWRYQLLGLQATNLHLNCRHLFVALKANAAPNTAAALAATDSAVRRRPAGELSPLCRYGRAKPVAVVATTRRVGVLRLLEQLQRLRVPLLRESHFALVVEYLGTDVALSVSVRLEYAQGLVRKRQRLVVLLLIKPHLALCVKNVSAVDTLLQPQRLIDVQRLLHECQRLVVPTQLQVQARHVVEQSSALRALPPNARLVYLQRL